MALNYLLNYSSKYLVFSYNLFLKLNIFFVFFLCFFISFHLLIYHLYLRNIFILSYLFYQY